MLRLSEAKEHEIAFTIAKQLAELDKGDRHV